MWVSLAARIVSIGVEAGTPVCFISPPASSQPQFLRGHRGWWQHAIPSHPSAHTASPERSWCHLLLSGSDAQLISIVPVFMYIFSLILIFLICLNSANDIFSIVRKNLKQGMLKTINRAYTYMITWLEVFSNKRKDIHLSNNNVFSEK